MIIYHDGSCFCWWKEWKVKMECKKYMHLSHFQKCLDMQQTYVLKHKVEEHTQWNHLIMKKFQNQFMSKLLHQELKKIRNEVGKLEVGELKILL